MNNDTEAAPPVAGWLRAGETALLRGSHSGVGKSFVALDMALSVVTGTAWHGHAVTPGPVVFMTDHGVRGLRRRCAAWLSAHGQAGDIPPKFYVDEVKGPSSTRFAYNLTSYLERTAPTLLVLDCMLSATTRADETPYHAAYIVRHAEGLRAACGPSTALLLVDYAEGFDLSDSLSVGLLAAADVVLDMAGCRGGQGSRELRATKTRNAPPPAPLALDITPHMRSAVLRAAA